MSSRLLVTPLFFAALIVSTGHIVAGDAALLVPAASTTTPSTSSPDHKHTTTSVLNGTVEKISETSLTIRVANKTCAHKTGPRPNAAAIAHPSEKSMTFQIGEIPPVKIVTEGSKPTRTTGSFSDVKVGDMVAIGTGPVKSKADDGKTTTQTQVTGIDVLKH
jgi:hypothetical protein